MSVPPRVSVKTLQPAVCGGEGALPTVGSSRDCKSTCGPGLGEAREPVGPVGRKGSRRGMGWPVTLSAGVKSKRGRPSVHPWPGLPRASCSELPRLQAARAGACGVHGLGKEGN